MTDKTSLFNISIVRRENIKLTLKEVFQSLELKGYNPINQLVGYLMSGDSGYISNYQNARDKILEFDRSDILEYLLIEGLQKCDI